MKNKIVDIQNITLAKTGDTIKINGEFLGKVIYKKKNQKIAFLKKDELGELTKMIFNFKTKQFSFQKIYSSSKEFHELTKKYSKYL